MKIIGVIPARYKSSRFPGKPLVEICGKPMIYWVYHQAMKVKELNEIYVATDDKRIRAVCEKYDMNVKMTKDTHQTGSDRVAEVAEHTDGDLYINIQGDEPVINPEMIREVISIFTEDESVYFGSLKKEITDPDEIRAAIKEAQAEKERPTLIIGKTVMGKGARKADGCLLYTSPSPRDCS